MSKELEAYKLFLDDVEHCIQSGGIHYIDQRNKDIIEKALKALEIIKNNCDIENIISFCVNNEKERDLLKEVLL